MIRALSLIWTLTLSIAVTAVSFFYVREDTKHGFPFSFARNEIAPDGSIEYMFNYWSVFFDILIWWLLFSLVWIIVKNYVLEV